MRYLLNGASRRVETDLRDDLFGHLMGLSAPFFQRLPVGDLMARATNDLLALRMVAGPAVMYLVDTTVRTIMIVPMMATISPSLTLWALLPTLGLPLVMTLLGGEVHRRSLAVQDQFGDISSFVQEHLAGVRVVRAYAQEARRNPDLSCARRGLSGSATCRWPGRRASSIHCCRCSAASARSSPWSLGGRSVIAGRISVGGFVAFGVYLATLVWPMIALGWAISLLQRGDAATDRINALFDVTPDVNDPVQPAELAAAPAGRSVRFEAVWFRYPGSDVAPWALQDVSFEVAPGRVLGLVGATGSGKTTVIDLLSRTYDPDRGRILIDGMDIRELRIDDVRRAVGVVPQETFLFSETLRDNVLLGMPDDGRLEETAQIAQLTTALPDLPNGWETMLGERGINLSGGQRQRAAIARALVRQPSVLVLDDALSAVDAHTEMEILTALEAATAERTRIIVSHRFSAVRNADQILVLDEGRIVERGTHDATRRRRRPVHGTADETGVGGESRTSGVGG